MQTPGQQWFSRRSKLADFFGLKRNLVILLIAIFVIGAGEELWMRFVPKYLQALGATVFVIGLYDALRTLLGAIYAYPGGVIADRWGHRHAFIIFNVVSIVGYALVLLIPNWGASDRRNVFLSFMDLFFFAGNVFACRRFARSTPPFHGYRRSISDQTIADHGRADFRRNVDRSLRNHPRRANCASLSRFFSQLSRFSSNANSAKTPLMNRESPRLPRRRRSAGVSGGASSIQSADATFAVKRHFDSLLRTSSLCVGGDFCDGLHRHERSAGGDSHVNRNARRHIMYHSRFALRRSISARAIRNRDLYYVHAFSDQLIDVAQFFRPGHRICDSWLERIRRYIAQSAHHRIQRSCQTRPNDRFILSRPRFDSQAGAILGAYLWKLGQH